MHASVSLGRIAGVEVGLNWSWLIVVGLIAWSLGAVVFPDAAPGLADATYAGMAATASLLFFAGLLLHELGHAVQARREGMRIEGITLWVFGGVARFSGMFPSAGAELRVAIAGPLVTAALIGLLGAGAAVVATPVAVHAVLAWLARINVMLLAFNMLPALPLDGGRVLRALLWLRSGDFARATRTAGGLGRGFGTFLMVGGAVLALMGVVDGLWFAMIGWFLTAAAASEARLAELRTALAGLHVGDLMVRRPDVVDPDLPLAVFVADVLPATRRHVYPVVDGTAIVGELTAAAAVARERRGPPGARVRDAMVSLDGAVVVDPDEPLFDAAVELLQEPPGRALVLADGHLAGLLSITDVSRLADLRRDA